MSKRILSDSDSEDDVPLTTLKQNREAATQKPTADSNEESEDEIPLAALHKKRKEMDSNKATTTSNDKTPKKRTKETNSASPKEKESLEFRQQECSERLYDSIKGNLVQELLCRWWYAMDWPLKEDIPDAPEAGQELDGFQGAYIVVKGDDMGSITDTRVNRGKPTFLNLFALPSAQLRDLLLTAYTNQMKILSEHEKDNVTLLKSLENSRKVVAKVNADKADREAKKKLKRWKKFAAELEKLK